MTIDIRPTVSAPDDDPYIWLEDIEAQQAVAWVDAQNAATLQRFGGPGFIADRDMLRAILDRPDNIPFIARRGALVFNFWNDAEHPRGLWRSTTLDRFRAGEPEWDIILDVDQLAASLRLGSMLRRAPRHAGARSLADRARGSKCESDPPLPG